MYFKDAILVFAGLSCFFLYLLIGAYIGYRRNEAMYGHCEKASESLILLCYLVSALLWPLQFPFGHKTDLNSDQQ